MFVRGCFRVEELICSSVDGSLKEPSLDMPAAIHTQTCLELLTHTCRGRQRAVSVRCCWDWGRWRSCGGSSVTPEADLPSAGPTPSHSALLWGKGRQQLGLNGLSSISTDVTSTTNNGGCHDCPVRIWIGQKSLAINNFSETLSHPLRGRRELVEGLTDHTLL